MNFLDSAIKAVSPGWWAARQKARYEGLAFEKAKAAYEGATRTRRGGGWEAVTGNSVNAENEGSLRVLRNRCRDLARNTWIGRRAVNVRAYATIGSGIKPSMSGDSEVEARIKRWAKYPWLCDADERKSLYGIQSLAYSTMVESGEALILRRRSAYSENGLPLKLQVREPDWLDETYTRGADEQGNFVVQGVEFDRYGRRVAYHMFKQHPGDLALRYLSEYDRERIPADDVIHVFREWRPGQVRGIPRLAPVILKIRDLEDYEDAQLIRQKVAACFTAFVTTSSDSPVLDEDSEDGDRIGKVAPGMIVDLKPGETVEFGRPPEVQGFRENSVVHQREIAAGMDVSYEALTGDFSEVTYSSARMGRLQFDASVDHDRNIILLPQFLYRLERWWADGLAVEGLDSEIDALSWTAPKRQQIDPLKETKADAMAVRNGFTDRHDVIRERGKDPETVDERIERTNEIADEKGFIFDSDPRRMNGNSTPNTSNEDGSDAS